jgi:hypothetical protein
MTEGMNDSPGQQMTDAIELVFAVPPERDLPAGHLEERRQALVQAVTAAPGLGHRLRTVLGWLVSVALLAAVALTLLVLGPRVPKHHVVELAAVTGTASIVSVAWRPAAVR